MAIYISGVKGLPEQVQENKENIKTIQEEIKGIDFEHIRELDDQVAENTGDINNLEGAIGVQNIAIESINDTIDDNLKPRVLALETKTTAVSYDSQNTLTTIDSSAKVNGNIYANSMQDENQRGAITLPENADESVVILNNSGGTLHSLIFNKDGNLLIDGNPVGKTYYRHNITFTYSGNNYNLNVVSSLASAYGFDTLLAYMYAQGFTDARNVIHSVFKNGVTDLDYYYYTDQSHFYVVVFREGAFLRKDTINSLNITDNVVEI